MSRDELIQTEAAGICERYRASMEEASAELVAAVDRRPALRTLFDDPSVTDRDLARRREFKDAVRDARKRVYYSLRQYRRADDDSQDDELVAFDPSDREAVSASARRVLAMHASTAERLDDYPALFDRLEQVIPAASTVVDIGCGIHPLAYLAFGRPLPERYLALDRDAWSIGILESFVQAAQPSKLDPRLLDLTVEPVPEVEGPSVGVMLKYLTVLDRTSSGAAARMLDLPLDVLVVTGNVKALAKRNRIAGRERQTLLRLFGSSDRAVEVEFELPSELGFVLGPRGSAPRG